MLNFLISIFFVKYVYSSCKFKNTFALPLINLHKELWCTLMGFDVDFDRVTYKYQRLTLRLLQYTLSSLNITWPGCVLFSGLNDSLKNKKQKLNNLGSHWPSLYPKRREEKTIRFKLLLISEKGGIQA